MSERSADVFDAAALAVVVVYFLAVLVVLSDMADSLCDIRARAEAAEAEVEELRARLVEEHDGSPGVQDAILWEKQCHAAEGDRDAAIESVRALRARIEAARKEAERQVREAGDHLAERYNARTILAALDGEKAEACSCERGAVGSYEGPSRNCPVHGEKAEEGT